MAAFINKSDYNQAIHQNILDQVTKFDDTKLDVAENAAIELMTGYLNSRYDTDIIFQATGDQRNPVILMYAVDITLYHLHSNINPRKIPDHRKERYDKAIEWLEGVSACRINPPSLPKIIDGTRDYLKFGGNPKRDTWI